MSTVSKHHPLNHYQWGKHCDAWVFVDNDLLSVKQEYMPAETEETLHYHNHAQQFFYLLKGVAKFEVDNTINIVQAGEGIYIKPGSIHRIMNTSNEAIEFIVCSQPSTTYDRYNA